MKYKSPSLTVDILIEKENKVLLIRRKSETFNNYLALPGGFVDYGEEVEKAAIREALEELNIEISPTSILGVYSDPKRDPRKHVISVVFICSFTGKPIAGDDASSFEWISLKKIDDHDIAFDHNIILNDYLRWKRDAQTFWSMKNRN